MATTYTINGVALSFPTTADENWGANVTAWAGAVSTGLLQKAGGLFTLTADVDFGANFGLKSLHFSSRTASAAAGGILRLARTDAIRWRNVADDNDHELTVDGSDNLVWNGSLVQAGLSFNDTATIDLTLASSVVTADVKAASISNTQIAAAAAIALNKLAALTASRAVASDSSGFLVSATATAEELDYLSGVSSALQPQINARLQLAGGTMTGPLVLSGAPLSPSQAATKQYVDDSIMGLAAKEACRAATNGNVNLAAAQDGAVVDGVTLNTGDRVLVKDQSDATENGIYVIPAVAPATRATDADTFDELVQAFVFVEEGTTNANSSWTAPIPSGGTLGADDVFWVQFGAAASYSADGQGIELSGSEFSLELDGSTLSKSGSGLAVAAGGITNAQINASAAIAFSKLATLTASRALVSNGSGEIAVSGVTTTELGYSSGVTGSIQSQLNARVETDGSTPMTGRLEVNLGTGAELTSSCIRVYGYSPAIELLDKDAVQNWHVGIDDNDGNAFVIARGYGPGQGTPPAIKITSADNVSIPSGSLTLAGDPTANLHAATKQYVDANAGDGMWTLIASGAVGGPANNVDFTSLAAYDSYKVTVRAVCSAASGTEAIGIQLNGDSGATYGWLGIGSANYMRLCSVSASTPYYFHADFQIDSVPGAYKTGLLQTGLVITNSGTGTAQFSGATTSTWANPAQVSRINVISNASNASQFQPGTEIRVYGRNFA